MREFTAASFSLIRQYLILAAPRRSTCFSLGGANFKKHKVYRSLGAPTIILDEVGVAFSEDGVHYGEVMRFRVIKNALTIGVTSDYDDIFRRYLSCLLIKQVPKLIVGLIGAWSERLTPIKSIIILFLSFFFVSSRSSVVLLALTILNDAEDTTTISGESDEGCRIVYDAIGFSNICPS
ncbi:unnamed protein product [Heligmosomoides polygyrus]|uniref:ABC transporter domain-containing protein n=1 Tax=Heligmosomoides polygyrus TaxID=6339 RepID=A0A183GN29_HELPZ|nr:unnamed protein product [Heligmosomoides polygyrus]